MTQRYRYGPAMEPGATFDSLVGDLDYPMFIVTACADGERAGCLIGFATQASIDPSRFLVCLSHNNRTYEVGRETDFLDPRRSVFSGGRRFTDLIDQAERDWP